MGGSRTIYTPPTPEEAADRYIQESGLKIRPVGDLEIRANETEVKGGPTAHFALYIEPEADDYEAARIALPDDAYSQTLRPGKVEYKHQLVRCQL